jgi:hypothetical protein
LYNFERQKESSLNILSLIITKEEKILPMAEKLMPTVSRNGTTWKM